MNQPTKPPSIRDVIRTLNNAEDDQADFVIACTFNLYIEAIKRIHGRVLLRPSDVKAMFSMVDTLMTERDTGELPIPQRSHQLTEEEERKLLAAVVEPSGNDIRRRT